MSETQQDYEPIDLDDWIFPSDALTQLTGSMGGDKFAAAEALVSRFRVGAIKVAAKFGTLSKFVREHRQENVLISSEHWQLLQGHAYDQAFWQTANVQFWDAAGTTRFAYYAIRVDPRGIAALTPPRPVSTVPLAHQAGEKPSARHKPAVDQGHLEAWAELFLKLRANEDFTEKLALESARGMFPDKYVSRDRVRPLLGPRKRGPKSKSAK